MVVEALVSLTRIFVPWRARRNANGEAVVKVALLVRFLILLPLPLSAALSRAAFLSEKEPESGWIFVALTLLIAAGALAVWWPVLRWSRDGIFLRAAFRRGKWYAWDDLSHLSGSEQSWRIEMEDGIAFKGTRWTSGGGEFLEQMEDRMGGTLPEY